MAWFLPFLDAHQPTPGRISMSTSPPRERPDNRPLAAITEACSGIGFELARCCANQGFDLLIASDDSAIQHAAQSLRATGVRVQAVEADLGTCEGVDVFCATAGGRPIEALLARARPGLGHACFDQDFDDLRHVVDTDLTGTAYLICKVAAEMRARNRGRILIAGVIPEGFSASSGDSKAFLRPFSSALRTELGGCGVTVTRLLPEPGATEFLERAEMREPKAARRKKLDPAVVARIGFEAMMKGCGDVVMSLKSKPQTAVATIGSASVLARRHRRQIEPAESRELVGST
jgi:short-subunit dehydrogenase